MKILVTGARGFIGRHVAEMLHAGAHEVCGLGHGAWTERERDAWGVQDWLNGDVVASNLDTLAGRNGTPDAIVHLAGGSAVGPSLAMPAEDFRRSVTATGELLEWVRSHAPRARVVMASSAAVYGAGHAGPIPENAALAPFSPYGFHKRMAELLVESYVASFGVRAAIVRLFSVYGPHLRKQLLWDACVRLDSGSRPLTLGGTGQELRDWLHVKDAARVLVRAIDLADERLIVLNGGTGTGTPVRDIANLLSTLWGIADPPIFSGVSRAGDPKALVAQGDSLAANGVSAQIDWRDGIAEYVAWFKSERGMRS